ncbi:MAG: hypothetical protein IJT59_01525, partial [Desulfovibrionaceae bacterium]|nr:hypothetical protein [Desulfovibrionaceae bacterium]
MLAKIKANLSALSHFGKLKPLLSKKMLAASLFGLAAVSGATFWFGQTAAERAAMIERAAKMLDAATAGTPLAGSGNLLRKNQPMEPEGILHPPTNPGTLAGPVIRGESGLDGMVMPDGSVRKDGEKVLKPVVEDSRLSKNFLADLAGFIIKHYQPGNPTGVLNLKLAAINQHCATLLTTEPGGGRHALLNYAFRPTMLRALYQFYVDYFLDCLAGVYGNSGQVSFGSNQAHVADFLKILAAKLDALASTMNQILDLNDFTPGLEAYETSLEEWESLSAQLTLAEYDLAQLAGLDPEASELDLKRAQMRVAELTERLEQAAVKRDENYAFFLDNLKGTNTPVVDDETLLFVTLWMQRRLNGVDGGRESLQICVDILDDLAKRLKHRSKDLTDNLLASESRQEDGRKDQEQEHDQGLVKRSDQDLVQGSPANSPEKSEARALDDSLDEVGAERDVVGRDQAEKVGAEKIESGTVGAEKTGRKEIGSEKIRAEKDGTERDGSKSTLTSEDQDVHKNSLILPSSQETKPLVQDPRLNKPANRTSLRGAATLDAG